MRKLGLVTAEVGMGGTRSSGSDRYPVTVIEVIDNKGKIIVAVQSDNYKRVDNNGFSESQSYEFSPNPNGSISHFRLNIEGKWEGVYKNSETGRWCKQRFGGFYLGERDCYYDFSF